MVKLIILAAAVLLGVLQLTGHGSGKTTLLVLGAALSLIVFVLFGRARRGATRRAHVAYTATRRPPTRPPITTVRRGPAAGRSIATVPWPGAARSSADGAMRPATDLLATAICGWCLNTSSQCLRDERGPMLAHPPPCSGVACTKCYVAYESCPKCRT